MNDDYEENPSDAYDNCFSGLFPVHQRINIVLQFSICPSSQKVNSVVGGRRSKKINLKNI